MRYRMNGDIEIFPMYLHGVMPEYTDIVYHYDANGQ